MIDRVTRLATAAGAEAMKFYGLPLTADRKADDSPLTKADLASHRHIVAGLRAAFPDIPVISEEDGERDLSIVSAERYWLVDPLDGTKEFLKQTGTFTVNIGLVEGGEPVLGVIHAPVLAQTFWAARGQGAWKQEGQSAAKRIQCSSPQDPLRFVASRDHAGPEVTALLARFPGAKCLSIGSSLKFCLVAEGAADAYLRDVPTMEWDTAAAQVIVTEAGGVVLTHPDHLPLAYGKAEWRNGPLLTVGARTLVRHLFASDPECGTP